MPAPRIFHLIFHTHWDREWYLPRAAFQARLVPATRSLLSLMERDGDARFLLDGQTILVDDVLAVHPEWRGRIAAAIMAGHLEVGPWYVLADELIPSGESLVRNLLAGRRTTAALGAGLEVLYSPDAFGHPAAFPALAHEFGIRAAVAWRGLAPTGEDVDLYRWSSPDGRAVLLHHLPPAGYEFGIELVDAGDALAARWTALRATLVARAATDQVAVFIGADHHAPVADPGELRQALQALEPEAEVRISTLGEYFAAVAGAPGMFPSIRGELRWSYGHTWTLQGVHGTRARLKRRHAATELALLRHVEPLAALARVATQDGQRATLRGTIRTLLECQFHDTLCGCCHDDVAREQGVRLTSAWAAGAELRRAAIDALCGHDADAARQRPLATSPALLLWNPAARMRRGVMTARVSGFVRDVLVGPLGDRTPNEGAGFTATALRSADGVVFPFQVLTRTGVLERSDAPRHYPDQDVVDEVIIAFQAPAVTGLGFGVLTPVNAPVEALVTGLVAEQGRLANGATEVLVSEDGRVDLIDQRSGERYDDLFSLLAESDYGDSYTAEVSPSRAVGRVDVCRTLVAAGPLVAAIELTYRTNAPGMVGTPVRLLLQLHSDSSTVRATLLVENRSNDHRTRLRLPAGVAGQAIAGAAFGFERRDAIAAVPIDYPAETPVSTAPAQRYVAVADGPRGLAICSTGFFEYEWTASKEILITVVRSIGELSRNSLTTRVGHAGWPTAIPDAQEPGTHVLKCAVTPITIGDCERTDRLETIWEDAMLPIDGTFVRTYTGNATTIATAGLALHGSGLVFSALKPAEDGSEIVARCFNALDTPVAGEWHAAFPLARARSLRADETPLGPLPINGGRCVPFVVPARGMSTIGLLRSS